MNDSDSATACEGLAPPPFSAADFCAREIERTSISDKDLFRLAAERAWTFQPDGEAAVPFVLRQVERALKAGEGWALVRIGDGEGAALGMTRPELNPAILNSFHDYFDAQNVCRPPLAESIAFCHELRAAIRIADALGFRCFSGHEPQQIAMAMGEDRFNFVLGLVYAREMLVEQLKGGAMGDKHLTSAWIHLDLVNHMEQLLQLPEKVVVISGRSRLIRPFWKRLKGRLFEFIEVPPEEGEPCAYGASHLGSRFAEVKQALARDLRGALVLVGAGMFGKIYCAEARKNGGVAVDMGSAFDLLSGLITRPAFADRKFDFPPWV